MTPAPLSDTRPHGAPAGKVGSRGPQLIYLVITNGLSAECTSTDAIPFASLESALAYAEEQIRDWGQNSRYEGEIERFLAEFNAAGEDGQPVHFVRIGDSEEIFIQLQPLRA